MIQLHRAKRIDNGEWIEGYAYRLAEELNPFIMLPSKLGLAYKIDADTVCLPTSQKDQSKTPIWEHDLCIIRDGVLDEEDGLFEVLWDTETSQFVLSGEGLVCSFDSVHGYQCEIVGNSFDYEKETEREMEE